MLWACVYFNHGCPEIFVQRMRDIAEHKRKLLAQIRARFGV